MSSLLFPFHEYWWLYLAFTAGVVLLLSLDLGIFHRRAHVVTMREAAAWTTVWVAIAMGFAGLLYVYASSAISPSEARRLTLEFLTGYVIEESLSIDNMFVFALVFRNLAIPDHLQHRVLFYGIAGALFFRAAFIAAGAALMQLEWVPLLFGLFLIVSGLRMLFSGDDSSDPENNGVVRWVARILPATTSLDGQKFFTRIGGTLKATPLLVTLLVLEMTDIIFAMDSVPAIFAVTSEPFLVFTSNVLAILGLRSLYFLLAGALSLFHMLKYGLSLVLIFVGAKMSWLDDQYGGHFPIGMSLLVITGIIGGSLLLSLIFPRRKEEEPCGSE